MKILKALLSKFSFVADEVMSGYHVFERGFGPPGRHLMYFEGTWGPINLLKFLTPGEDFLKNNLRGRVTAHGLCEDSPMLGTLKLSYHEGTLRYEFGFDGEDGKGYTFVGEKVNIRPWNLPVSHTTCFGRITEDASGKLISTGVVFFRMSTALDFLRSFRLKLK